MSPKKQEIAIILSFKKKKQRNILRIFDPSNYNFTQTLLLSSYIFFISAHFISHLEQ